MAVLKSPSMAAPSLHSGLARSADQSAYPGLWDDLILSWCPALGITGGQMLDMSGNGRDATVSAYAGSQWDIVGGKRMMTFNGTTQGAVSTTQVNEFPMSIIWTGEVTEWNDHIFGIGDSGSVPYLLGRHDSGGGSFRVYCANQWNAACSTVVGLNVYHQCGVIRYSRTSGDAIQNGIVDGAAAGNGAPSGNPDIRLGRSSLTYGGQKTETFHVWNRALTLGEVKILNKDPLAMYRFRNRTPFLTPVAAGGISIPVVVHHLTQQQQQG